MNFRSVMTPGLLLTMLASYNVALSMNHDIPNELFTELAAKQSIVQKNVTALRSAVNREHLASKVGTSLGWISVGLGGSVLASIATFPVSFGFIMFSDSPHQTRGSEFIIKAGLAMFTPLTHIKKFLLGALIAGAGWAVVKHCIGKRFKTDRESCDHQTTMALKAECDAFRTLQEQKSNKNQLSPFQSKDDKISTQLAAISTKCKSTDGLYWYHKMNVLDYYPQAITQEPQS